MLIKDICISLTDGSHNPPQGISESSFLMLSSKNVFDDNITLDEPRFLSKEDFEKENKRTNIKTGDILLTIVGTIGRSAVVTADLPPFTLQRSVAVLHPNIEVCNERYLMYALQGRRSYIENRAKGVAQKGIYLKEVAGIDVPIPAKDVQNKIVAKMDKVNSIIKYRRRELLKLDELVKARFVELFGDSTKYPKEPLNDNVEQMFIGPFGSALKNECFVDKDSAYCMVYEQKHAIQKTMDLPTRYVNETKYQELKRFEVHGGDIIVSCRGTIGEIYSIPDDAPMGIMHPSILKIRLKKEKYCNLFFVFMLEEFMRKSIKKANGSGIKMAITATELGKKLFVVPTFEQQNEFANFVKQIDKSKFYVLNHIKKLLIKGELL